MIFKKRTGTILAIILSGMMAISLCACAEQTANEASAYLTKEDITVNETFSDDSNGGHAIEVSGEEATYSNIGVTKTGDADGDEADFYGENSAVFATEKATLTITDSLMETNGRHANGVFSYGEGTVVNISNSVIETQGDCSGGLMTTGGGTMNAENLTINTSGRSSAAIRSDRGGGTVTVSKGYYKTTGMGSPVVYSTADITVSDAYMESTASQGVVVEGKNSVTLNNDTLVADNNTKNSDKSEWYQAVMIYQSMSGDAAEGTSSFAANGGSITNKNGDIFFVTNTATEISLSGVEITNEDAEGLFLRAAAAGWGNDGSNGGQVNLNASGQTISGNIVVDDVSMLNLYLKEKGFSNVREVIGLGLDTVSGTTDVLERGTVIYPQFETERCIGCGRCVISCMDGGHQAIRLDESRRPKLNGAKCVGCHLCVLVCPQGAVVPGTKRVVKRF